MFIEYRNVETGDREYQSHKKPYFTDYTGPSQGRVKGAKGAKKGTKSSKNRPKRPLHKELHNLERMKQGDSWT